jgi:hypothetical protein
MVDDQIKRMNQLIGINESNEIISNKQIVDKDPNDIEVLNYGDPHKTKAGQADKPMPKGTGFAKEPKGSTNESIINEWGEKVEAASKIQHEMNKILYNSQENGESVIEGSFNDLMNEFNGVTENIENIDEAIALMSTKVDDMSKLEGDDYNNWYCDNGF